jgi:hypothetical protein
MHCVLPAPGGINPNIHQKLRLSQRHSFVAGHVAISVLVFSDRISVPQGAENSSSLSGFPMFIVLIHSLNKLVVMIHCRGSVCRLSLAHTCARGFTNEIASRSNRCFGPWAGSLLGIRVVSPHIRFCTKRSRRSTTPVSTRMSRQTGCNAWENLQVAYQSSAPLVFECGASGERHAR